METRSEHHMTDNGARVEVGVFVHEGREFSALGSVRDDAAGYICGYPENGRLMTWDGQDMGIALKVVSTWRTPRSFFSPTQSAYRAWSGNVKYHGRGAGDGSLLRLYRSRS